MIPKHIAIIMDGNGRWAQKRLMPRFMGHREGAKKLKDLIEEAGNLGVKYVSVYAFSTENWKRPQKEVDSLMELFHKYLEKEKKNMLRDNIRFKVSGRREGVSESLIKVIEEVEELTKENNGVTFNICFNYGGRAEIIDAVNKVLKDGRKEISEEEFSNFLYNTKEELPDPELVIRTSGEFRISNFLLWQIAYSEFYITDILWPDFTKKELRKAVESFGKRDRKFGGVKNVK